MLAGMHITKFPLKLLNEDVVDKNERQGSTLHVT